MLLFKTFFSALYAVLMFSAIACNAQPALLIGNANYMHVAKLANPTNDVAAFAEVLFQRGFDVQQVLDANKVEMDQAISDFLRKVAKLKKGLIYFAGHGVQLNGKNYLVSVEAQPNDVKNFVEGAVSLQYLLDELAKTSPEAVSIILDACRDDPFAALFSTNVRQGKNQITMTSNVGLGEAGQRIPKGIIVAYGASANQSSLDSLGNSDPVKNGVFTRHLLRYMSDQTLSIQQVMRRVRDAVISDAKKVNHRQIPSTYDALMSNRFLMKQRQPLISVVEKLPKNINIVVPGAEGGPTDLMVRAFAERLVARGVNVIIKNVIDILGDRVAAMEFPFTDDGVALLVSSYPASLRRELAGDQRFKPLGMLTNTPIMLATHLQNDLKDMKTLVAETARRSSPWKIGISGPGSQSEACFSVIKASIGTEKMDAVVYRGMGPAMAELLNAKIDMLCDMQSSFEPFARTGKIRYIANLQEEAASESNVATAQEQGYAVVVPNWSGLFAPSNLPQTQSLALIAAIQEIVADPKFIDKLRNSSTRPVASEKSQPLEINMSLRVGAEIFKQ